MFLDFNLESFLQNVSRFLDECPSLTYTTYAESYDYKPSNESEVYVFSNDTTQNSEKTLKKEAYQTLVDVIEDCFAAEKEIKRESHAIFGEKPRYQASLDIVDATYENNVRGLKLRAGYLEIQLKDHPERDEIYARLANGDDPLVKTGRDDGFIYMLQDLSDLYDFEDFKINFDNETVFIGGEAWRFDEVLAYSFV